MQLENLFLIGRCTIALENFLSDFLSALFAFLKIVFETHDIFFILPNFELQKN